MTPTSLVRTRARIAQRVSRLSMALALAWIGACSSSSETPGTTNPTPGFNASSSAASDGGALADASHVTFLPADSGAAIVIEVPSNASVCGANLPFKPPGCACDVGQTAACWTGPAAQRNLNKCRDGVQKCLANEEFGAWGPCEGEVLDCGQPPPPPPDECKCIPGKIVGCDEDCTAVVFCAPFSTKVCQPDGKFGPCRESLLPTGEDTNACINVFNGCLPGNLEGVYVGDCGKVFTCGHPPDAMTPQ